jgi:Uma2 family endonuclease
MAQSITTINEVAPSLLTLNVQSVGLSKEQFEILCRDNPDRRIELTVEGNLIIMPPTGFMSGWRNSKLAVRLGNWAEADGTGMCFDSSTLFTLPNGAKRSPDASWIRLERCNALTDEEKEGFAPICPDFVLELRSATDSLSVLQDKMTEYIENGAQLGWLIDPKNRCVHIYRPNLAAEILVNAESVNGEPVLKGFVLNLGEIWSQ